MCNMRTLLLIALLAVAGCDKALHFGAGLAISQVITEVTDSRELGCVSAIVAGAAKEAMDAAPNPIDFVATVVGGCSVNVPL